MKRVSQREAMGRKTGERGIHQGLVASTAEMDDHYDYLYKSGRAQGESRTSCANRRFQRGEDEHHVSLHEGRIQFGLEGNRGRRVFRQVRESGQFRDQSTNLGYR